MLPFLKVYQTVSLALKCASTAQINMIVHRVWMCHITCILHSRQIQIQFYWTCSQKAKNQKAKQTVMHRTTKRYDTIQEMKCNAMRWKKQWTNYWYLWGRDEWKIFWKTTTDCNMLGRYYSHRLFAAVNCHFPYVKFSEWILLHVCTLQAVRWSASSAHLYFFQSNDAGCHRFWWHVEHRAFSVGALRSSMPAVPLIYAIIIIIIIIQFLTRHVSVSSPFSPPRRHWHRIR